ncbi:MAG: hypothetical protein RL701_88 [Pseudomonadota bacterium]
MRAKQQAVYIVGTGAITAVGACSAVSAAAVRAGISRTTLLEQDDGEAVDAHVARVQALTEDAPRALRLEQLLAAALRECLSRLVAAVGGAKLELPLFIAAPDDVDVQALLRACQLVPTSAWSSVQRLPDGHAAGFVGLERACEVLGQGSLELACVVGVDTRCDTATLLQLSAADKLLTADNPWGIVAGEAAGALLLASEDACTRLGLTRLGRVHSRGSAQETSFQESKPCTGRALSAACHSALDAVADVVAVSDIYCDLNGVRARHDEWGFTAPRIAPRCRDVSELVVPALLWGDVGSATAPLLVQLALAAFQRGYARGTRALVWAASEAGLRAAVILEPSSTIPASTTARAAVRALDTRLHRERAQDDDLASELLADASFMYDMRTSALVQREREPEVEHHEVALRSIERRLEAFVDGVISARAAYTTVQTVSGAAANDCGETYANTRLMLAIASPEQLCAYLQQSALSDPERRAAIARALAHDAQYATAASVSALLADENLRALGLQLATDAGIAPSWRWRDASQFGPTQLGPSFPRALARFGVKHDVQHLLEPWLSDTDPSTQLAAAIAYARLDRQLAQRYVWAERQHAHWAVPLVLCVDARDHAELETLLARAQQPTPACLALGLLGTVGAVAVLLERFATAPIAAARALHLITGCELFETRIVQHVDDDDALTHPELLARRAGDAEVGTARVTLRSFQTDCAAWRLATATVSAQFAAGQRYRLGKPLTAATALAATAHPLLAPSVQTLCADDLAINFGRSLHLRSDTRVAERCALIV